MNFVRIDGRFNAYKAFIADLVTDTDWYLLETTQDGVEQKQHLLGDNKPTIRFESKLQAPRSAARSRVSAILELEKSMISSSIDRSRHEYGKHVRSNKCDIIGLSCTQLPTAISKRLALSELRSSFQVWIGKKGHLHMCCLAVQSDCGTLERP